MCDFGLSCRFVLDADGFQFFQRIFPQILQNKAIKDTLAKDL